MLTCTNTILFSRFMFGCLFSFALDSIFCLLSTKENALSGKWEHYARTLKVAEQTPHVQMYAHRKRRTRGKMPFSFICFPLTWSLFSVPLFVPVQMQNTFCIYWYGHRKENDGREWWKTQRNAVYAREWEGRTCFDYTSLLFMFLMNANKLNGFRG